MLILNEHVHNKTTNFRVGIFRRLCGYKRGVAWPETYAGFLGFEHPRTGEMLEFEVGYPVDFKELLEHCRSL